MRALTPGIAAKLFIAILVTNVVTTLAVGLGVRAAFESGFESYVKEREERRLTRLAGVIADAYAENGSWDFLRGNDARWIELNHLVRPELPTGPPPGDAGPRSEEAPHGEGIRAPPPHEFHRVFPGEPGRGPRTRGGRGFRPPPGNVLDEAGNVIVGDAKGDVQLERRPIVAHGKRVGWLASVPRTNMFDVVDRRFQTQQSQAAWIAAGVAVLIAAIVALFVTRGMLTRLKRIANATRELADGRYATRVEPGPRDELGGLADDFNRLGNVLEKNERIRRNFMADVSHELRTPLAVLKGEVEALQDGVRQATPETLESLHSEVARLSALVDDIHQISLADVGALAYRFGPVDLEALVREALQAAAGRIESHRLAVELDAPRGPALARGDEARLSQVIANLLENSLRYTDAGGMLKVAIRTVGSRVVLTWEDSAPGVPDEALERLFERFYRVEASRNRERGGSGLGLSIARSIVEAHGGTIVARASALGGLAVEVQLPASGEAA